MDLNPIYEKSSMDSLFFLFQTANINYLVSIFHLLQTWINLNNTINAT